MKGVKKSIETYLASRNAAIHTEIQDLFKLLASKGKSKSGDSAIGVRDICIREFRQSVDYFVEQLVREKRLYSNALKDTEVRERLVKLMNSRIIWLNQKRDASLRQVFGKDLRESMVEASSPQNEYSKIKNETIVLLDEKLLDFKESKGKTVKDRVLYQLNNNWLYLLLTGVLAVYSVYKTIEPNG